MLRRFHRGSPYELSEGDHSSERTLLSRGAHPGLISEFAKTRFYNALCSLFGLAVVKLPRGLQGPLIPWRGR
jgi:hypothetical protein